MAAWLRFLAVVLIIFSAVSAAGFFHRAVTDDEYRTAAMRRERNPNHILFESEFRVAQAQRVFLVYSGTSAILLGLVGGSLLLGVASLHRKVDATD